MIGGMFSFWINANLFAGLHFHILDQIDDLAKGRNLEGPIKCLGPEPLRHYSAQGFDFSQRKV